MNITKLAVVLSVILAGGLAFAAPPVIDSGYEPNLLDVKFKEGTTVRLRQGRPTDVGGQSSVQSDLRGILGAFGEESWDRTHSVAEEVLDRLRQNGQANRTKPLPDLNNYFRLQLPPGMTAVHAKEILERYPSVEAAYFVPKPVESPTAPDYSQPPANPYQDYLDAAPNGIDARNAWSRGWTGSGVKVCDVEYWINFNHVDLPPISVVGRIPWDPFGDDHGTGVWGEIASKNDGTGTTGISYGVSGFLAGASTDIGYSVVRPLMECGAAMSAGDVVLIEQQMVGPFGGQNYVPMEWSKPVYDAILTLVANGINVVETTGNGGQNLDDPVYSTGNDNHWPFLLQNDSGALLVTGGQSPHMATPRSYQSWSNYGATVDLQGWGDSVVTTGAYPTGPFLYSAEGKNVYYRSDFSGSSSSGPMITGAVALLEQAHKQQNQTPAPPALIKSLLVSTGTAQAGARHLGPLPNLKAALDAMNQVYYVDSTAAGLNNGTSWANAFKELNEAIKLATPGARILIAEGTYLPDWNTFTHVHSGDRTGAFLLKNGVTMLGGYPHGGGTRDPQAHVSILSGNIGSAATSGDNSYNVVSAAATIDDSAVLDGFTVSFGHADGPTVPYERGAGILILGGYPTLRQLVVQQNFAVQRGAGIYNESGAPSLQHITLVNNSTNNKGGGMWNENGSPRLTFITFQGNTAVSEGGGLFTEGGTPHIENSRFLANQGTRGGGLSSWLGTTVGSVVLDSVEFQGNQATSDIGGGVFDWQAALRLNNVTLSANSAPTSGGGIYVFTPSTVTIRNSILWGNTGGDISGAAAAVSTSIVQGGYPGGTGILNVDPLFRVPGSDLRVKPGSPALDAGAPSTCAANDVRGMFRDPEVACDLGAYEYLGNPGTFWTNGEVDLISQSQAVDVPGVSTRESAEDFVVPAGKVCDVTAFRGVLQDASKEWDAVAHLYHDASGYPGTMIGNWTVHSYCSNSPGTMCVAATDCSAGGTCVVPGQSLGHRADGKLWEPNFNVTQRLSAGTYWLSIYATMEPGSGGGAYAISASEGAIRSNPYRFRFVGFSWVDGGAYNDDIDRDLALEVDATCLTDADGDGYPAGEDCNDNNPNINPGMPELCDGIDNNCDGVVDPGTPPTGIPVLTMPTKSLLSWTSIAGASGYDVVHGNINNLRSSGGNFTSAGCEVANLNGTSWDIGAAIPPGGPLYYLVRVRNVCGGGTYDDGSPKQVQSRDAEIAASANACP
ncbi:MAG TPA: MopE-related protein [Candidatus Polarisedimenticolaceae bacterium]|nr:MopE-related protein [Candidatus Polarisedimenticolaceae bacterium]